MDASDSYRCNAAETLYDGDSGVAGLTKLTVSNMQLKAFQNTTKAEFSDDGLCLSLPLCPFDLQSKQSTFRIADDRRPVYYSVVSKLYYL